MGNCRSPARHRNLDAGCAGGSTFSTAVFVRFKTMKTAVYSLLFIAALVCSGAIVFDAPVSAQSSARPQQPAPPPTPMTQAQDDVREDPVFVREVQLPITVLDKKDQPLAGLKASDFVIFEDKQQQQIASFRDEAAGTPIYVAVLMDISSSAAAKLRFEKEACQRFSLHGRARAQRQSGLRHF
jgi:hypothetical protein